MYQFRRGQWLKPQLNTTIEYHHRGFTRLSPAFCVRVWLHKTIFMWSISWQIEVDVRGRLLYMSLCSLVSWCTLKRVIGEGLSVPWYLGPREGFFVYICCRFPGVFREGPGEGMSVQFGSCMHGVKSSTSNNLQIMQKLTQIIHVLTLPIFTFLV